MTASPSRPVSTGDELRRLGLTYTRAAELLGLSRGGLNQQMGGERRVSRQTQLLLAMLEQRAAGEHGEPSGERLRA